MKLIQSTIFLLALCSSLTLAEPVSASQWDDQIDAWSKELPSVSKADIPKLEASADGGDVRSAYLLYLIANRPVYGWTSPKVYPWMQAIAKAGNPIGMLALCYLLREGVIGVAKNEARAFEQCLAGAQMGFGSAMNATAYHYLTGRSEERRVGKEC